MPMWMWLACGGGSEVVNPPDVVLGPDQHLIRASIAARGRLPDPADVDLVRGDPSALASIVEGYLELPEFGDVIRDMHAELFLTRTDIGDPLPLYGPLQDQTTDSIYDAISEEPLKLVEHVVVNDMPYTEILTLDYTLSNAALALVYGLDYDPDGPEWQATHYIDGRPHAGVLTSSEIYRRHESAGSNFHRGRASFWSNTLLCEPFDTREIVVAGGIDLTDEAAVANAVLLNENCVGCHQAMDPLASNFFGFKQLLRGQSIRRAYDSGCRLSPDYDPTEEQSQTSLGDMCYPLRMYNAGNEEDWDYWGVRAPAYFGEPVMDLPDLGIQIGQDPRFAQCTARRFYAYLAQVSPEDVPLPLVTELQEVLVDSGFDVKELTREILLSDAFTQLRPDEVGDAPLQVMRSEAYARVIEDLTGFVWLGFPSRCNDEECWDRVDLGRSDLYGYRAMAGGIDGLEVIQPTHTNTPVRVLVHERFAQEAAGYVVDTDFAVPAAERRQLTLVEVDTTDDERIREQLVALHRSILMMDVPADHQEIDETLDLFRIGEMSGGPTAAWKLVVSLLLQDPRLTHY